MPGTALNAFPCLQVSSVNVSCNPWPFIGADPADLYSIARQAVGLFVGLMHAPITERKKKSHFAQVLRVCMREGYYHEPKYDHWLC